MNLPIDNASWNRILHVENHSGQKAMSAAYQFIWFIFYI